MKHEVESIFLFVSELTGSFKHKLGKGTEADKIAAGRMDYVNNKLHDLDLTSEEDRADLHENIWLERLYGELDEYFSVNNSTIERGLATDIGYRKDSFDWSTPIEVDATASLLMITGALLGSHDLLNMTNAIEPVLEDAWTIKGLDRLLLKKAATPMLYGSSQNCKYHWKHNKLKFTKNDVKRFNQELKKGALGLANDFKELIINNVKPQPKMKITIWKETFDVYCNHTRSAGADHATAYKAWDSDKQLFQEVVKFDENTVPDLDRFRLYFQTLIIHHLDSVIADTVMQKLMKKYGWGIPIHDAIVLSPKAAKDVRKWFIQELAKVYDDREVILKNFCKSVGIDYALVEKFVAERVTAVKGTPNWNTMALK